MSYVPHERVTLECEGKSRVKQSFAEESNINNIMAKYEKTGILEHVNEHQGNYGDFADVEDYQTSVNKVIAAKEMFMGIPARIRADFENDPGKFLDFATNPENEEAMREYGLLPKKNVIPPVDESHPEDNPEEPAEPAPAQ